MTAATNYHKLRVFKQHTFLICSRDKKSDMGLRIKVLAELHPLGALEKNPSPCLFSMEVTCIGWLLDPLLHLQSKQSELSVHIPLSDLLSSTSKDQVIRFDLPG
jgi:hypothetical protein